MKIHFVGATHQVTGSCTLLEWHENRFLLIDCGMEQGVNHLQQEDIPISPSQIEYVVLTHAHIDHSGNLPLLYKNGFRGKIYSTFETMNLCSIMLRDSAHIQESEAEYQTRKNMRAGEPPVLPAFTLQEAEESMRLFRPCNYGELLLIDEGLSAMFNDAGHLLGSSFVELFLEEGNVKRTFIFSGDVGNINQPIIKDPQIPDSADYLLIESTYGDRFHEVPTEPVPFLAEVLRSTFSRDGSVIIPSFAVGRTQEILYFIREIKQNNLIPEYPHFPVYVDSPLANEATAVFLQCDQNCLDDDARSIMKKGLNPIWFDNLFTIVSAEESRELNTKSEPKVIIASGGMCEGGRIRHHLKHNLWNEKNTILFAGYQAEGTLGRLIYDGCKKVKIFGEEIEVNAEIRLLKGISGHADQKGLLNWIRAMKKVPGTVFVNHGDDEVCTYFADLLRKEFHIDAFAPYSGSEYDLAENKWILQTEPLFRNKGGEQVHTSNIKKGVFMELLSSVDYLKQYALSLEEHSNHEIRELTRQIDQLTGRKT